MNRFKFVPILFIVIIGFVLLVGGTMPYFLFYIFLMIFLLPLIHSLITLKSLKGQVNIPKQSLFSGDKIDIGYEVENKSFFSIPYLEIQSDISKELTGTDSPKLILSLEKKKAFSHKETVILNRRGYYQVGDIGVTIRDVFGFYSFSKKITSSTSLIVYPETINISTFNITASHESGELLVQDSRFQDKSRINSLREYREGDSIKAIHWKLSTKKDIPIVKDYESRGDTHAIVFIDNYRELFRYDVDRRLEDKAADTALSIIVYCLRQNIEVNLETQSTDRYIKIQGQQNSDLKPFLKALAMFKGDGFIDFKSFLLPRIETLRKGSTVIIITSNLDKNMGAHGIHLKMKNLNPLFIIITDMENRTGFIDPIIQNRLSQDGILLYIIDYKTSVKEALEVYNG